jgi:hypothetical protein
MLTALPHDKAPWLATPLPDRNVEVAWRAGLDLRPVALSDVAEVRWLQAAGLAE